MNCERFPGAAQHAMPRCRPGIVRHTEFATIPDQRCTGIANRKTRVNALMALHRVREKRGSWQCIRQ